MKARIAEKLLSEEYQTETILADTGQVLGNLLLEQGLVDEISLLIHPIIVGKASYNMFGEIHKKLNLKLLKKEILEKDYIWLVYKTKK